MDIKPWIGVALFLWLLGFLPTFFGFTGTDEAIRVPKWLAVFMLSKNQNIPVPSFALQLWGFLILVYAITLLNFIPNIMLGWTIGLLLPLLMVKIFVDYLRN